MLRPFFKLMAARGQKSVRISGVDSKEITKNEINLMQTVKVCGMMCCIFGWFMGAILCSRRDAIHTRIFSDTPVAVCRHSSMVTCQKLRPPGGAAGRSRAPPAAASAVICLSVTAIPITGNLTGLSRASASNGVPV